MNSVLGLSRWGRLLGKRLSKPIQKYKPETKTSRWNIITGDLVQVIDGPHNGQQGKILQVIRSKNRVIVEGVNMVSHIFFIKESLISFIIYLKKSKLHFLSLYY